jgi:hypothetical protein
MIVYRTSIKDEVFERMERDKANACLLVMGSCGVKLRTAEKYIETKSPKLNTLDFMFSLACFLETPVENLINRAELKEWEVSNGN